MVSAPVNLITHILGILLIKSYIYRYFKQQQFVVMSSLNLGP